MQFRCDLPIFDKIYAGERCCASRTVEADAEYYKVEGFSALIK